VSKDTSNVSTCLEDCLYQIVSYPQCVFSLFYIPGAYTQSTKYKTSRGNRFFVGKSWTDHVVSYNIVPRQVEFGPYSGSPEEVFFSAEAATESGKQRV